ncbi:MAG TPA: ribokinase [bacterium]|nr:ribokinase [bacterium]
MDRNAILVVGSANMDMVVVAEKFPQPGETLFGRQFNMYPGGKGANQAVCAAKLGGETHFIGRMGNDLFRERLVQNMASDGVVMDHLLIDEQEPTGIALITVDGGGENEIIVISGSNMKLSPADVESRLALFNRVGVVLAQLEIPLETVARTAELAAAAGACFILNPAPACKLPVELLQRVDFLTPNRLELELLAGMSILDDIESIRCAAQRLLDQGVGNLLVTLGDRGSLWVTPGEARLFAARRVQAVDTTAAGDAFNGAFAFALSRGETVPQAIHFANHVAAFSVTQMGAQSSMPTAADIEEWV